MCLNGGSKNIQYTWTYEVHVVLHLWDIENALHLFLCSVQVSWAWLLHPTARSPSQLHTDTAVGCTLLSVLSIGCSAAPSGAVAFDILLLLHLKVKPWKTQKFCTQLFFFYTSNYCCKMLYKPYFGYKNVFISKLFGAMTVINSVTVECFLACTG